MTVSIGILVFFALAALICTALSFDASKDKLHKVATILLAIALLIMAVAPKL